MEFPNILLFAINLGCAILVGGLAIPLLRRRVKPNALYGVRIPEAFESEERWYEINEYGGRRLLLWSYVLAGIAVLALFVPLESEALEIAFALAPLLYLVAAFEAWRYARRTKRDS